MSWQTQAKDQPLFEDIIWSRPGNKRQAGKLLIIGGHGQQFAKVASAYQAAQKAGAGTIKVMMPASLEKMAAVVPGVEFAPANKIGSFAKNALAKLLDASSWADAILLAGDLGKNSETTAMLDSFLEKNEKLSALSNDSLQSLGISLDKIVDMDLDLVLDFKNLQKLGSSLKLEQPFVSSMVNNQLAQSLSELSKGYKANIIVENEDQVWVASQGNVANTRLGVDLSELSAYCVVWHMQHSSKPLEAMTSACYQLSKPQNE